MAVIHVLDKHTAELIAAGEVVERPASAIKELVENAIDANAHQITVTVENGGVSFMEVSDDGSGIEAEYIGKAFIRHATSKIACEADLDHIHTLGFRGEALASIASVARVQVLTKTEPDEFACDYRIEGGQELGMEAGARGVGTTIRVRDLFYNTPARMKFLKKDASEGTFVAEAVSHAALSHPEISFKFVREGKVQFVTPGNGDLRGAAYAVLGREFARDLIAVDDTVGNYRVAGLVTPPKSCRASRGMQTFFINGRYVKNRTMMAAMESAFKGTTMQGKFPGGILMLSMPVELVDVNVHPAKTEVRFARENDVFEAVYHAVRSALAQPGTGERLLTLSDEPGDVPARTDGAAADGSEEAAPHAPVSAASAQAAVKHTGLSAVTPDQSQPGMLRQQPDAFVDIIDIPIKKSTSVSSVVRMSSPLKTSAFAPVQADEAQLDIRPDTLPGEEPPAHAADAEQCRAADSMQAPAQSAAHADEAAANASAETPSVQEPEYADQLGAQQTSFIDEPEEEPLQYVGELFRTYIVAQRGDEVCFIDKHAAHERILYEKLARDYGNVPGQLLLAPAAVEVSAEEKQALLAGRALLQSAGFDLDDFGGSTVLVREVPSDVEPEDVESLVTELAAKLAKGSRDALSEQTEWVLHSIACRAAIKAGDTTPPEQLIALAQQILSGAVPPFCPHGRPCVLKLTRKELEKQFGRIQ